MKRICPQCRNERTYPSNRKICSGCRAFNLRVNRGEILPPTYGDVTTEGYKDPMQPVVQGFGFVGAITRTTDGEKIQCHICGYFFNNLGSHVRIAHTITAREYKYKFGLRITEGLVSFIERTRMQVRYNDKARTAAWKGLARIKERRDKDPWQTGGDVWSPQTRNLKGMCREQTIAKIKHIASLNDGIPILADFLHMYGTGQESVIAHWFGTWNRAVEIAGFMTYKDRLSLGVDSRKKDLMQKMRDFYELYDRTPQSADFNSNVLFPPCKWIIKNYGSLNKAREAAGVPLLIHVNGSKWEEVK
jgi:hypothetical protein